jgi:excisionase family DNA binding protein
MKTSERRTLTAGEAARQLGLTIDAVLDLVYRGEITAAVERTSGRLMIDESALDRWRSRQRNP